MLTQSLLRVQEDERKQIAYDLHDDIVQDLVSLKMTVDNMLVSYFAAEKYRGVKCFPVGENAGTNPDYPQDNWRNQTV